jgi:hypothetical protein
MKSRWKGRDRTLDPGIPDLPERLVKGIEFHYVREFFSRFTAKADAISDVDVKRYASSYASRRHPPRGL